MARPLSILIDVAQCKIHTYLTRPVSEHVLGYSNVYVVERVTGDRLDFFTECNTNYWQLKSRLENNVIIHCL